MSSIRWTKEQLKLAFHLYCQLPFGKLHSRNLDIVDLATLLDRTPSAVAMKLVNFASLDPSITATGRTGLGNASNLDREVWKEFHADWEGLATECAQLRLRLRAKHGQTERVSMDEYELGELSDFTGETRLALTNLRIKQQFFRRAVLSSYRERCCMSGLSEARLLVASHIVPWSKDKSNRLNPSNGLCLSALHDKAFDCGLLTLSDDCRIVLSAALQRSDNRFVREVLLPLRGRPIDLPERFVPDRSLIARHREEVFLG
jgi:hypothetical protein